MSRCDYDGVFYRVFCVTLLATAFTFTVILTNVFIDIDGLLSKRGKQSHDVGKNENDLTTTNQPHRTTGEIINDENDIDDALQSGFRTKRSSDSLNFDLFIKKHKMEKIYSARLAKLLKQLNEDVGLLDNMFSEDRTTVTTKKTLGVINIIKRDMELRNNYNLNGTRENEFIPNVRTLFKGKDMQQIFQQRTQIYPKTHKLDENSENLLNAQNTFYDKEIKLKKIHKISRTNSSKSVSSTSSALLEKEPNDSIGTPEKDTSHLPEKTKETSKYWYQDKTMDFNILKKDTKLHKKANDRNEFSYTKNEVDVILKPKQWDHHNKRNQLVSFNSSNDKNNDLYHFKALKHSNDSKQQVVFFTELKPKKRSKRHIKVRYDDIKESTPRQKPHRMEMKRKDDDLYVEIETHFDGKGVKGERKKKLVRNLIDRIQKAIRSDVDTKNDNHANKASKHLQIKKRIQNPLKHSHEESLGKYTPQYNSIDHRKLNPINIILPIKEITRDLDENLEDPFGNYLNTNKPTISKLAKSFEMTNPDAEINNVLNSGIPQRFQVPLNNEDITNHAKVSQNAYADTGNVTLFIKDIDGSGFSVGFNQYMDEAPDVESMKIFSGLENVIKSYHENYDQNANVNDIDNSIERQHEVMKRDVLYDQNEHVLLRRSIQELQNEDYHSNAYKIFSDKKVIPYEYYRDILHIPSNEAISSNYEYKLRNYNYNPKNIKIVTKDIKIKALPLTWDNEFEKKSNPSEILSLANLLLKNTKQRKKRSLNVQRITNLKSRIKLNRYLNTKTMQSKKVFLKNKRNKREIKKIRIIASDHLHHTPKNSNENIFLMSGEKMFSNRAVLREIELPESETGDERGEEQGDTIPYTVEESNPETNYQPNNLGDKYNHDVLMSKYPHIFTDSITGSKEFHFGNENDYYISENKPSLRLENLLGIQGTSENIESNEKNVPEIVDAILPSPPSKSSYKVTVKILPKNLTNAPSGFKEMHTIINKTYNNNGVQYYSLVNVSEISKIENINKTKEIVKHIGEKIEPSNNFQEQDDKMKLLIGLQKKKIEEQLKHLNTEKDNLEAILRERNDNKGRNFNDLLKEVMIDQPQKDTSKVFTNNPDKNNLQIQHLAPINHPTTPTSVVTVINLEPTTAPKVEPKIDAVKTKIKMTIQENQNFTNEILARINKNTDILQSFLKKLVEKLEPISQYQTKTQPPYVEHVTEEIKHSKIHPDLSKDWGVNLHHMHDTFFNDHIPHKNDSHYAIPFVYAYQHPYLPAHQPPLPMAKVVYHGHIHTNAIHNHANEVRKYNTNNSKLTHGTTKNDNTTRFFIDAMEKNVIAISPKVGNVDCKHNFTGTIGIR